MKLKDLKEQVRQELLQSSQTYCCYCLNVDHGFQCCGENHFLTFGDLYDTDQDFLILEAMSEMMP